MKAVVSDLDGTLVKADGTISVETLRALRSLHDHGIALFLATARSPAWISSRPALAQLSSAAVCCGGAVVWNPSDDTILWRHKIAPEILQSLVAEVLQHQPQCGIAAYDGVLWYMTERFSAARLQRPGPKAPATITELLDIKAVTLSFSCPGRGDLVGILAILNARAPKCPATITSRASFGGVIDIGASGLHKGDAVSWLMAQWGIGRQDAVAFGDDLPDLHCSSCAPTEWRCPMDIRRLWLRQPGSHLQ
jgi:hydroxymethylpyrimidine pyrophosphatase-like HAD family hydrolase